MRNTINGKWSRSKYYKIRIFQTFFINLNTFQAHISYHFVIPLNKDHATSNILSTVTESPGFLIEIANK